MSVGGHVAVAFALALAAGFVAALVQMIFLYRVPDAWTLAIAGAVAFVYMFIATKGFGLAANGWR